MKFKKEHPIYLDTVLQPKICNSGVYEYVHSLADFDKLYWKKWIWYQDKDEYWGCDYLNYYATPAL